MGNGDETMRDFDMIRKLIGEEVTVANLKYVDCYVRPRMLLFRADENGIIFHTASTKDVYRQIMNNPKAEMCFFAGGTQVRISGVIEPINDDKLKEEIFAHPSRKFLQQWKSKGIDHLLQVFVMKNCSAVTWIMATNFSEKQPVKLC